MRKNWTGFHAKRLFYFLKTYVKNSLTSPNETGFSPLKNLENYNYTCSNLSKL